MDYKPSENFLKAFKDLDDHELKENNVNDKISTLFLTIKNERKRLGLNQTEFANIVGISRRTLSSLESGNKSSIDLASLLRMCDFLNIDLFEWSKQTQEFEKLKRMNESLIRYISSLEHDFGALKAACKFS